MEVQAQWAEWGGSEYVKAPDVMVLSARTTPEQLHVTLPSGLVLTFARFDRAGRARTNWWRWYGGTISTRRYLSISLIESTGAYA